MRNTSTNEKENYHLNALNDSCCSVSFVCVCVSAVRMYGDQNEKRVKTESKIEMPNYASHLYRMHFDEQKLTLLSCHKIAE